MAEIASKRFATRLRRLMDERNVSRSKLGKAIGAYGSTIQSYLEGSVPTLDKAEAIARYFKMSLGEFLGDVGNPHTLADCYRVIGEAICQRQPEPKAEEKSPESGE